ncbi:MAG: segregation and condensation protein A [Alphaproteobacteria bacterium]
MTADHEEWEAEPAEPRERELVLDLEGYGGPLDVLLVLAREQKVDLARISILRLADQFLAFIADVNRVRLEIAADYLVMAAWLAYLKSRLLLPEPEDEDEPTGPELAEALTFRLRRLEAMRDAGGRLMALPRLGLEVFRCGSPEGVEIVRNPVFELSLYDMLKAYGDQRRRTQSATLSIEPTELFSLDDALERLGRLMGRVPDWQTLQSFLPSGFQNPLVARSAVAATLSATLELARTGVIQIRQTSAFGPIYLRSVKET